MLVEIMKHRNCVGGPAMTQVGERLAVPITDTIVALRDLPLVVSAQIGVAFGSDDA
jgi:hypothetical protein